MSERVCDTIPPCSFTPGEVASFRKWIGTCMRIGLSASTRWKSMCTIAFFAGCIWTSFTTTCCLAPATSTVTIVA